MRPQEVSRKLVLHRRCLLMAVVYDLFQRRSLRFANLIITSIAGPVHSDNLRRYELADHDCQLFSDDSRSLTKYRMEELSYRHW